MIIPIDTQTVAIENAADLRDVVSVNSAVTHVYFADDITLTSGITIHPDRKTLVLDGTYEGVTHTLTDMQSTSDANTLGIRSASSLQMTLRNMNITGRNFYGVPFVADSATTRDVSITYDKVVYSGRQITHNRYGVARYIDCDITITSDYGTGNEVAEVNRVEIGGKTKINKTNSANSTFWFCGTAADASFTILTGAEVEISTAGYFMYKLTPATGLPYTIEPGASLKLSTATGLSYNNDYWISDFLVGEGASFDYTQSAAGIGPSIAMTGTLTAKPGSRFFMRADYTGSMPLIRFRGSGGAQNLNLESPKSFVVCKNGSPALNFTSSRPFSLSGQQVNYWDTLSNGTFADPPLYPWHQEDWSDFDISGSVGTSMSGVTSSLTEPVDPSLSGLELQSARVLSVGDLPLIIHTVVNNQRPITGATDPYADIRVAYSIDGTPYALTGTADGGGAYSIPTPTPLPVGTVVTVSANVPYLYRTAKATAEDAGELYIEEAPIRIRFITPPLSQTPCILGRNSNGPVVVKDMRKYSSQWELLLTINGPMRCLSSGHTLNNAVVFVPAASMFDTREVLQTDPPIRVYVGGPDQVTTTLTWPPSAGLLLQVEDRIYINEEYVAQVTWRVNPI